MPISEVFNEDCMIGMARYPDNFFDLAIVDPPYGIKANKMTMGSTTKERLKGGVRFAPNISSAQKLKEKGGAWDNEIPSPKYFAELKRTSINQVIWGGNYFPLPPTRGIVCWDKRQPWDSFSQWEMAWTSFDKPAAIFRKGCTGGKNNETKIHPTQKPLELYAWLLGKFAQPGNKILDTHMGSQSSRIAAYQMGFDYFGWEIDRDYFETGNKRFKEQTSQLKLL